MDPNFIIIPLAILQTAFAGLEFHRNGRGPVHKDTGMSRWLISLSFTLLTWAAVGLDYYDRHFRDDDRPDAVLTSYGIHPPTFYVTAQFKNWEKYKTYRALLITRINYADRDRMEDDWIDHSVPFTITSAIMDMGTESQDTKIRFSPNAMNSIEYDLTVLPSNIDVGQIKKLADVSKLGGMILATAFQMIPVGGPVQPSPSPPAAAN